MSSLLSGGPKAAPILVHIDMKGGPPTLDYLLQLLPLLKSWGATGILIEWEDMFPYWGTLKVPHVLCIESFFVMS
jgi:hexosaminidase